MRVACESGFVRIRLVLPGGHHGPGCVFARQSVFKFIEPAWLRAGPILSGGRDRRHPVRSGHVLRRAWPLGARRVPARLVLCDRGPVGAERHVQRRFLLPGRLELADAKPVRPRRLLRHRGPLCGRSVRARPL